VTGCSGFVARSLIGVLRARGERIYGTSRRTHPSAIAPLLDHYAAADLSSADEARAIVASAAPDLVIHLASRRTGSLAELLRANAIATDNLLRAVRDERGLDVRVVVVGSSAEVGFCGDKGLPIAEDFVCQPVDDYGVSKLAQSSVAHAAYLAHGQSVVRIRPFNLIGPGLPSTLLPGRCVELIKDHLTPAKKVSLCLGNLDTSRDYTDVRDVCRAILLVAERGESGALYHVGSGRAVSGHEVVRAIAEAAGVEVEYDTIPRADGRAAVPIQIADAGRAQRELDWHPEISFEQSIRDMWMERS
jgi:GDP-4-dehydro-6-deoxy-D-mannose reductase